MQRLEHTTLPLIQPKLWIRYVDDTFIITKRNKLEETHHLINNMFVGIKFTGEENNNQFPFLDIRVECMTNVKFQTSVYRKATHTDENLNFHSNHTNVHKQSCIRRLFKWAMTYFNTLEPDRKEEEHLYKIFTIDRFRATSSA
eukprot:g40648.t1